VPRPNSSPRVESVACSVQRARQGQRQSNPERRAVARVGTAEVEPAAAEADIDVEASARSVHLDRDILRDLRVCRLGAIRLEGGRAPGSGDDRMPRSDQQGSDNKLSDS
jgi:hypothetical protein